MVVFKDCSKLVRKSKYPKITNTLSDITDVFTFLEFPESIRPSIYSNDLIEGWNKQLKRRLYKIIDTTDL